jgi:hypothetical protein
MIHTIIGQGGSHKSAIFPDAAKDMDGFKQILENPTHTSPSANQNLTAETLFVWRPPSQLSLFLNLSTYIATAVAT